MTVRRYLNQIVEAPIVSSAYKRSHLRNYGFRTSQHKPPGIFLSNIVLAALPPRLTSYAAWPHVDYHLLMGRCR